MDAYLLVTIDTESDNLWAGKKDLSFDNLKEIPRLHHFLERHEVRPTYLVSYPVATSQIGREVLQPIARSDRAELGSHMHVWTTPPLKPVTSYDHSYCPLATEITEVLLKEKMKNLTNAVGELSGSQPQAHRAGRYALDSRVLLVLETLGYAVDTSVTPLLNWRERAHDGTWRGPDFTRAPLNPYYPDRHDVTQSGSSPVLEVPVSYFVTRPLPRRLALLLTRLPRDNNLVRALRRTGLIRHAWLRPGRQVNGHVLIGVARALIMAGVRVLNVMFHSSEMAVGTSPHTRTHHDVEDSYRQLDTLLTYLRRHTNTQPVTLSELATKYRQSLCRHNPIRAHSQRLSSTNCSPPR